MRIFALLCCLLTLPQLARGASAKFPEVYLEDSWQQGGVGQLSFYPLYGVTDIKVSLINSSGSTLLTAEAFPYKLSRKEGGYSVAVALLGLSAQISAGSYKVKVVMTDNKEKKEYERAVTIEPKDYKKSIIKMGPAGTKIATGPRDPKRDEQAKSFYEVLNNFDRTAVYGDGKIALPISTSKWRYSSVYGTSRTFIYENGKKGYDFHNGQDFAGAPVGTPIEAVLEGKVVMAEHRVVTGGTVIIQHLPGVFTLYYHMSEVTAKVGKKVKVGEMIGRLGATGFATGPHLHLSLHVSGLEVDPVLFYDQPLIDRQQIIASIKGN